MCGGIHGCCGKFYLALAYGNVPLNDDPDAKVIGELKKSKLTGTPNFRHLVYFTLPPDADVEAFPLVAMDSRNNVIFSNGRSVRKYTKSGTPIWDGVYGARTTELPGCLKVMADNSIWITDATSLIHIDPEGVVIETVDGFDGQAAGGVLPQYYGVGFDFDTAGNLYTCEINGRVRKYIGIATIDWEYRFTQSNPGPDPDPGDPWGYFGFRPLCLAVHPGNGKVYVGGFPFIEVRGDYPNYNGQSGEVGLNGFRCCLTRFDGATGVHDAYEWSPDFSAYAKNQAPTNRLPDASDTTSYTYSACKKLMFTPPGNLYAQVEPHCYDPLDPILTQNVDTYLFPPFVGAVDNTFIVDQGGGNFATSSGMGRTFHENYNAENNPGYGLAYDQRQSPNWVFFGAGPLESSTLSDFPAPYPPEQDEIESAYTTPAAAGNLYDILTPAWGHADDRAFSTGPLDMACRRVKR